MSVLIFWLFLIPTACLIWAVWVTMKLTRLESRARLINRLDSRLDSLQKRLHELERLLQESDQEATDPAKGKAEPSSGRETLSEALSARQKAEVAIEDRRHEYLRKDKPRGRRVGAEPHFKQSLSHLGGDREAKAEKPTQAEEAKKAVSSQSAEGEARDSSWKDFETVLGTNWLNKVGIAFLVIGVSLLIAYTFEYLGPTGKISIGYVVTVALLAAGSRLLETSVYRNYARVLLAGGWALGYFTTYALRFVESVRLVGSDWIGTIFLASYTALMIAFTLRYRAEIVTVLTTLLGFATLGITQDELVGPSGTLILVIFVVFVSYRFQWFWLAFLGGMATFGCALTWILKVPYEAGPQLTTLLLLTMCWLFFLIPNWSLKPRRESEIRLQQGLNLVNACGFLVGLSWVLLASVWQTSMALSAAGSVYLILSFAARREGRRASFILFCTVGIICLVGAPILIATGGHLTLLWLMFAEASLIGGLFLRERYFRVVSFVVLTLVILSLLNSGSFIQLSVASFVEVLFVFPPILLLDFPSSALLAVVAAALYLNRHLAIRYLRDQNPAAEEAVFDVFTYPATVMVLALAIQNAPFGIPWGLSMDAAQTFSLGLAFAAIALLLLLLGRTLNFHHYRIQSYGVMGLGLLLLMAIVFAFENIDLITHSLTVLPMIAVFYTMSRLVHRSREAGRNLPLEEPIPEVISFTATASLIAFIAAVFPPLWNPVLLCALALGLVAFGLGLKERALRTQGYFAAMCGLAASTNVFSLSVSLGARSIAIVPTILAFYYISWILRIAKDEARLHEAEKEMPSIFSFAAAIVAAAFLHFEVPVPWASVAWGCLGLAFLVAGLKVSSVHFLNKAYLLLAASVFRALSVSSSAVPLQIDPFSRISSVVAVIALLCSTYLLLFYTRKGRLFVNAPPQRGYEEYCLRGAAAGIFVLTTSLLYQETSRGLLTVLWSVQALAFFLLGLIIQAREFRLYGLGLLSFCILKVVLYDLQGLETLPRIASFIGLGLILLVVSYLYTRYGRVLKEYL